jgi:prophage regulatory protein
MRLMRLNEVRSATGLGRTTIYMRIQNGLFPKAVSLGPRLVAWPEHEITALNAAVIRGASEEEIKVLVRRLERARANAA